ncbi:DUF3461 family protein [Pontibacterium granulatum]|uniref:DUF3461 family protein n=1 Tax=Pontibacterium granulatum TaxID=2036029 RepID=UPI00249C9A62|nr:DUF3461 family protein [Pontibacterium granulatum]MDI3324099.1 DUF3461 family protein [Pontibacterium granulatum]
MSEFNTLSAMGLTDVNAISHYKLSRQDNQEVLKVYFKRPAGSAMPDSSTFCFDCNTVVPADAEAASQSKDNGGSDPVLIAAVNELNALNKSISNHDRRLQLVNELDRLEQIMAAKLQELREDLNRIV